MHRDSSTLPMCIAPGLALFLCTCLLFFPISRADQVASGASSRRFKHDSFSSELRDTYAEVSNDVRWYDYVTNHLYSDTIFDRGGPGAPKERLKRNGEGLEASQRTAEMTIEPTSEASAPNPSIRPDDRLFREVYICRSSAAIWNVAVRNKMGELLIPAFAGSERKAKEFAKCVEEDITEMVREDYLTFAMYNCIGTRLCFLNKESGSCVCRGKAPERCVNIEYTRALIKCKYA